MLSRNYKESKSLYSFRLFMKNNRAILLEGSDLSLFFWQDRGLYYDFKIRGIWI